MKGWLSTSKFIFFLGGGVKYIYIRIVFDGGLCKAISKDKTIKVSLYHPSCGCIDIQSRNEPELRQMDVMSKKICFLLITILTPGVYRPSLQGVSKC